MADEKIFQVSEFNEFINAYLNKVGELVVEGEISNIKTSQNKWIFATIKDSDASVEVFSIVFKISGHRSLEPGMLVHVHGTPRLYQKTGRFSIDADKIIPAGEGALRIAFEKLKAQLEEEGLFDPERKRKLPVFPENIGLITAKGSRAYGDFIKILKERMGGLKIYFCPVQVQGKNSPESIVQAIRYFNKKQPDLDALILTRGGGSLEDLQSFNDESVARAIFASKIPVVSAVGHEDDISIADHVADIRASTPSNAAEILVKNKENLISEIDFCIRTITNKLDGLVTVKDQQILQSIGIMRNMLTKNISEINKTVSRFITQFLLYSSEVSASIKQISVYKERLVSSAKYWTKEKRQTLESTIRLLRNLDHRNLLKRGFSITTGKDGKIIKSIKKLSKKDPITTRVFDGRIGSEVVEVG